ncbi:MAG: OadG family protein [Vicinamibacteria bacterium]|jgi:Na+-transporting methylmalonyl-CoA/oxaloacetate decarboxylase gamma subunit|nr:OadG family protein [Vicinamibacteria bacterium]
MSALEAWTVTALGMAVVYIGLVACIGFIQLFGVLARRVAWGEEGHAHGGAPAPVPPAAEALALPTAEPVPGPVLAVIAAVLEVEHALYMNRPGSRVTIRRPTS